MASCLRCGREFQPSKRGHIWCSSTCRHLGPRHPEEPPPPPRFDADAVERLTDGPGGEALLRRALRLFGPGGGRERSTLIAATLREGGDAEIHELFEDALACMGTPGSSALERIAEEETGSGAWAVLDLTPEFFAPGWAPFPTGNSTPAQVAMGEIYDRVRHERGRA